MHRRAVPGQVARSSVIECVGDGQVSAAAINTANQQRRRPLAPTSSTPSSDNIFSLFQVFQSRHLSPDRLYNRLQSVHRETEKKKPVFFCVHLFSDTFFYFFVIFLFLHFLFVGSVR